MRVLITGGSKGIGKAIAERFASAGYDIFLCARNEGELRSCAEELESKYKVAVLYFSADASEKKLVEAMYNYMVAQKFIPDILVNNAGTFIQGNISDEAEGVLEKMLNINLYSAYHVTRAVLPAMLKQNKGHIFNICSIASLRAYANGGAYSVSKYALAGFSKNLREELKNKKIKVTDVYPGAVYTASWEGSGVSKERIMEADDIAKMIFAAATLSPQACVEEIVIRPQLGDL